MPIRRTAAAALLVLAAAAAGSAPVLAQDREQQKEGVKDPPPKLTVRDGLFVDVPEGGVLGAFTVTNNDPHPHMITGFGSPACGELALEQWDGSAPNAGPLELTVPGKNKMVFLRGGYHLHCVRPTRELRVGDTVPVTVSFENLPPVRAEFTVKAYSGPGVPSQRPADPMQNRR